jgi:L-threonylcarbamoyladenylate synthase
MNENKKIISILREGGIAIFPTDTAFGIGCLINNTEAVQRLFAIKKRSLHKPTPVLFSSISMVEQWVDDIPETAKNLMNHYWPGGLTIILKSSNKNIDPMVTAGTGTLGIRIPDSDELREIITDLNTPIIGSSANFEGMPTPYTIQNLDPELTKLVDVVMNGECKTKQASTVVDCTKDPFVVLREGAVKLADSR